MEQRRDSGDLKDLVLYRIESAKEDLRAAVILRDEKVYKTANNRVYYAIYHALSAVHCMEGD